MLKEHHEQPGRLLTILATLNVVLALVAEYLRLLPLVARNRLRRAWRAALAYRPDWVLYYQLDQHEAFVRAADESARYFESQRADAINKIADYKDKAFKHAVQVTRLRARLGLGSDLRH